MAQLDPPAGELDRRITIRLREDHPLHAADLESVFTEPRHRWAKVRAVGTAVYTDSVQTDDKITHRVWVRLLQGVTTSHEVVTGGVVYRVKRSAPWGAGKRFTLLEVEELGQASVGGGIYG
ncbi:head-tail adaptor protein [Pseudomonas putida]|uniref:Phage head-tail joining protein n=1 Tax=Pseudomonas putida TaxID=303 RepID=A0A1B2F161_PSEPU|nr:head-tail adaptor protein [Pseudomonas putida]ANY85985.1 Phage head-tail joining protein [Pseudomonas putida]